MTEPFLAFMSQMPLPGSCALQALAPFKEENWLNILLKHLTYPKTRRSRVDCCDNIHGSLLCPPTSQELSPALLLRLLLLSILVHLWGRLWVWFPRFVWDQAVWLQCHVSTWCDREFFILLAEPNYMDIKMNDFPFGILKSSQNWGLDQVLTGFKRTSITCSRPSIHVKQNPLACLRDHPLPTKAG